jgi:two-component system, OmpR family, sensor histidine kinase KdpD
VSTGPVALRPVVASAVDLFADRGPIPVDVPEHLPPVVADAGRVEQILANLLGNAYKYARDPAVAVRVTPDDAVEVSIVDRGDGLTGAALDEAFGKFSRGRSASRASGTGLGLFISRALAEAMGGSLDAESRPGVGSRFTLRLPVVSASNAPGDRKLD